MPDTRYNICLIAYFNSSAVQQLRAGSTRSCDVYRSIPLLLKSSLIPLLVVVACSPSSFYWEPLATRLRSCLYRVICTLRPKVTAQTRVKMESTKIPHSRPITLKCEHNLPHNVILTLYYIYIIYIYIYIYIIYIYIYIYIYYIILYLRSTL
ncbi:hypothetical protein EB796_012080 [Bugula neritina]|uniref:Uncharacterized protein n=1 Tax=Bugula neritina TaxID=10212 RepID=A0A7J7JW78_BUGNE|nr:hypothetical protein EB796_012080 [Bugula neritina]